MLFGMCFAPDGGRVLTACRDGQASLWDWQSGRLVCSPAGNPHRQLAATYGASAGPFHFRGAALELYESDTGRHDSIIELAQTVIGQALKISPTKSVIQR